MRKFLLKCLLPLVVVSAGIALMAYHVPTTELGTRYLFLLPILFVVLWASFSLAFYVANTLGPGFEALKVFPELGSVSPKGPDSKRGAIIYFSSLLLFIAVILGAMVYFMNVYTRDHLNRYGITTKAIIYKYTTTRSKRSGGNTIYIRFKTLEGSVRENNIVHPIGDMQVGDSVTIRYSTRRPAMSEIVE
jgi:hypothetical protein